MMRAASIKTNVTNMAKRLDQRDCKKQRIALPSGGDQYMWELARHAMNIHFRRGGEE